MPSKLLNLNNHGRGGVNDLFMATYVKKQPGQTDDQLIAAFRKKIIAEDLLGELKKREFYQPPSAKKYEKNKLLKKSKGFGPR